MRLQAIRNRARPFTEEENQRMEDRVLTVLKKHRESTSNQPPKELVVPPPGVSPASGSTTPVSENQAVQSAVRDRSERFPSEVEEKSEACADLTSPSKDKSDQYKIAGYVHQKHPDGSIDWSRRVGFFESYDNGKSWNFVRISS